MRYVIDLRNRLGVALFGAVLVVAATSCGDDDASTFEGSVPTAVTTAPPALNGATGYSDDDVRENFITACEGSGQPLDVCVCTYEGLSAPDGVPFDEFVRLDDLLASGEVSTREQLVAAAPRYVAIAETCVSQG